MRTDERRTGTAAIERSFNAAHSTVDDEATASLRGIRSVALPARSGAEVAPRFELLDSSRTGVDFYNHGAPSERNARGEEINFPSDSGAHTSGGVCIGDYDGDGRPDIFLCQSHGPRRLYRNLGDFRFQDVTEPAGINTEGLWGMGPTFADVDNDGDLDLFVCGYKCPNRLFVNRGDGTFQEEAAAFGLDYNGASVMMAFADYDLDGDLDAYLLTTGMGSFAKRRFKIKIDFASRKIVLPAEAKEVAGALMKPDGTLKTFAVGQFDHLFRNEGPGSDGQIRFHDVSQQAGIDGQLLGLSVTWWDYNSDRYPDLYVANDFYGEDQLYRNNGDGTFTDVTRVSLPHTPWYSMGSDTADINNDGRLDLIASDMAGTNHYNAKLGMGDMEEEGWFLEYPIPRQYMRNAVYLNTGTERFMEVAYLTGLDSSDWTWATKFADLDNDGWVDLFVTNGMTRDLFNSDLKDQERQVKSRDVAERFWQQAPEKRDANIAFRNQGDLRFSKVSRDWGLDDVGVSFGAAAADLDGDGDLDIVVNNYRRPASIYRNRSSDGRRVMIRLVGTASNRYGVGATVELWSPQGKQVRYLTSSRGYMSSDEPLAHFGLGDSEIVDHLVVHWPSGHEQRFESLPADRFYTITEPIDRAAEEPTQPDVPARFVRSNVLRGVIQKERRFDDFRRQPLLPNKLSQLGPGMAWGDVDGDGDEDLYLSGAKGQAGRLFVCQSPGQFQESEQDTFAGTDAEEMAPLFLDADADGDLDLYVVSGGVECEPQDASLADRLYQNDGRGRFVAAPEGTLPALHDSGSTAVAADFDRDGDLDLFVGSRSIPGQYPVTPQSRLLRNESGRFIEVTDQTAPGLRLTGLVTAALWSDVDADGWIDLLVAHEWGPVKLYRNHGGKLIDDTAGAGLEKWLGWWNGIAGGDLDRDGDVDYVVTNFGLNTKYHASAEEPVRIYYGDFDGSGRKQIVEAKVAAGGLLPVRGKSCSQNAMPMLREKFPTYESFALASLADIYTPEGLKRCLQREVNTLESGVLLNDGQGHFTFQPLPRLAQASAGFGVVVTEVNGDANPDIYLVQNFFGPQRETGHLDGGVSLLLLGNGDGTFGEVWPNESGLVVPGDAKSLTTTDLNEDGWPDFIVGINRGSMLAFENRGPRSEPPRIVRLSGREGNPSAVGARVTAHFRDGSTQAAEVYAGSGYLSQSSGTIVFSGSNERSVERIDVAWPGPDRRSTEFSPVRFDSNVIVIEEPIRLSDGDNG